VGSLLIWLSGAQRDILARCKADRPKYIGLGAAVLITATMAGVSMTFALHSALKLPLTTAIPFALAWGLAIMSLDRWLIVSLVRQPKKLNYLLLALPRVALGVLFGLIISTPFTLQIFQPEINQQITVIQQQRAETYYKNLANDPLTGKIKDDQEKVSADETTIKTGGTAGQNPAGSSTVVGLTDQLKQAEAQEQSDYAKWHCEIFGGPGCVAGDGQFAQADHAAYENDEATIGILTSEINNEEQQIASTDASAAAKNLANAEADLGPDRTKLATDQKEQQNLENAFNNANASNAGLLLRLEALDQVAASNGMLQAARWLLFLFFTAIECLPVLVKVLLNLGPENSYEKALTHAERIGLKMSEQETLRQYRETMLTSDALSEESERLHEDWQLNVLPRIISDTTEARKRVAQARLARWEQWASADDNSWTGPGGLSGTGHTPGTDWPRKKRLSGSGIGQRLRAAWQAAKEADPPERAVDDLYNRTPDHSMMRRGVFDRESELCPRQI
jgi:hypothetical protein